MTIASPCVKLCVLDDRSGLCQGCGRTLDEIAAWMAFDDDRRATIMATLPGRLAEPPGACNMRPCPSPPWISWPT